MYHKEKKNEILVKIVLLLVGLVYGLLDYFLPTAKILPDSIFRAVVVTLILFIIQELTEISARQKSMQKGFNSKELQTFMIDNKGLLADLACKFTSELEESIKVNEERLIVDHSVLAISSYLTFWKLLVDIQSNKKNKLTVLTTHSCDIEIWADYPLTRQLLQKQKEFVELGGTVERILCGKGDTPNQKIFDASSQMKNAGVHVFYYNLLSNNVTTHTFAWDFAHVVETGETGIWKSFSPIPGGGIEKAIYTKGQDYKLQNIAALWADIRKYSIEI